MKDFVKFVFASCLGVTLAGVALIFIGSSAVAGLVAGAGGEGKAAAKPNSILNITLQSKIPEKTNNVQVDQFQLEMDNILGVHDMARSIDHAKTDDNIQGIMIDLTSASLGQANAAYLRETIIDFKESGKFVLAYAPAYSKGTYYLASAADDVYINPFSVMEFDGFAASIPFFKGMLDKVGVKMQVKYAGQFKSATEPFRLFEMSDQNKLQVRKNTYPQNKWPRLEGSFLKRNHKVFHNIFSYYPLPYIQVQYLVSELLYLQYKEHHPYQDTLCLKI